MTAAFKATVFAEPSAIAGLTERVMEFLPGAGVDARASHHVALALEELLTNLATHGRCRDQPATIRLAVEPDKVKVEIADSGPFFDPRIAPEPNLEAGIEDREIGGLGLYLFRQFAREIDYARLEGTNFTTFTIGRASI